MKRVTFSIFGYGTNKELAEKELKQILEKLTESCVSFGLSLEGQHLLPIMNVGVYNRNDDYKGGWQAFAHLAIPKIKGFTYNQIYKLVNQVQTCSFKVENI